MACVFTEGILHLGQIILGNETFLVEAVLNSDLTDRVSHHGWECHAENETRRIIFCIILECENRFTHIRMERFVTDIKGFSQSIGSLSVFSVRTRSFISTKNCEKTDCQKV